MGECDMVSFAYFADEDNPDFLHLGLRDLPEIRKQTRKKQASSSLRDSQICGADTETIDGRCWLFSTEHGVWELDSFSELILLLYSKPHARKWKSGRGLRKNGKKRKATRGFSTKQFFFWNLAYDVGAVLKLLDADFVNYQELIDELITQNQVEFELDLGEEHGTQGFRIKYLEGKSFQIKPLNWKLGQYKAGTCYWWDISQFYFKQRLNQASKDNLGVGKLEKCFDGSILNVSRLGEKEYRDFYREDIEKYAILDAVLAGELTRKKRDDFVENGVRFIQPYSLANVAQRNLFDTCKIPTINDYMKSPTLTGLIQKAYTAFNGGWFECTGSGYLSDITAVDLASAYPYIMYHLPDISRGNWVIGDEDEMWWNWMKTRQPYSIGFCEAHIVFDNDSLWNPLVKTASSGTLVSPRMISGWFTADEIAEAKKWPHSQFIIGEWFYFSEENSQNRPFRPYYDRVYKMKMDAGERGDKIAYQVSKILANSIYGKTIQAVDGRAGQMFNPLYASTITGATRARLAELNRLNGYKAISKATDGVIFRSEDFTTVPNRPLPACYNLGQWEADGEGELLLIMSGVYSVKSPQKIKTTFRGSASYFLRNYQEEGLFGFCKDHIEESEVSTSINKPLSIRQARIKKDMDLINIFTPQSFTMKATGDSTKRIWNGETPILFGDLLENWFTSIPHRQLY